MASGRREGDFLRDQDDLESRLIKLESLLGDQRHPFTYSNGWRDFAMVAATFSDQGFFRDASGVVRLEGAIDKNGGNWVGSETMITLPVGYRPPSKRVFNCRMSGGGGASEVVGRVDVIPDGTVVLIGSGASNPVYFVELAGIAFRAA